VAKTTLIEALVPLLVVRGLRVSLVKHAHHAFDVDTPGKDSYRHRAAGCTEVLVSSRVRFALIHELRGAPELTLAQALDRLSPCDLALVEGYKRAPIPKLEVWREAVGKPLLHPARPGDRRRRGRSPGTPGHAPAGLRLERPGRGRHMCIRARRRLADARLTAGTSGGSVNLGNRFRTKPCCTADRASQGRRPASRRSRVS
jgi:molybdopterin-guanine dinucleotide biosynthesis protein MobB